MALSTVVRNLLRGRLGRWLLRATLGAAGAVVAGLLALVTGFYAMPLPERLGIDGSAMVLYADGTPAHVFLASDDRWRVPLELDEVDPSYVDALIRLEDKRFRVHPGVDPVALVRAVALNATRGEVVSGGSTLTMQLVRVLEPRPRTIRSKVVEVFRAMQLEWFLTKDEILAAYLTFVPYGRNLEGIEAASLSYFGHSARDLSPAEIATLLAVPQNPTVRYPTARNLGRLRAARDDVAAFLVLEEAMPLGDDLAVAPDQLLGVIRATPVPSELRAFPRGIPHLAGWLHGSRPAQPRIRTTIDRRVQRVVEDTVRNARQGLYARDIHNGVVVVVDHRTAEVVGLVGNLDFWDEEHGGQIVAFDVPRSPGSALKPFIYAASIDAGLVLPEQLVLDVPASFGSYAPRNYDDRFMGLVPAEEGLSRSLNLPFVFLLRDLGVDPFLNTLEQAGVRSLNPSPGYYGLSLAAGGVELTPLEVAGLYTTLANDGRARPLVLEVRGGEPPEGLEVFSPGATWLTRRALSLKDRPDFPARRLLAAAPRHIHWKTGTSFGHRDAWAAGSGPDYTAVVWLGNVDNHASKELVGAQAAGPVLFDVLEGVARKQAAPNDPTPDDLVTVEVCSYSGHLAGEACPSTRKALARERSVPTRPCPYHVQLEVDVATGEAVGPTCRAGREVRTEVFVQWPASVRRWLSDQHRRLPQPPRWADGCQPGGRRDGPDILSPIQGQVTLLIPGVPSDKQEIPLEAEATSGGGELVWFVDGEFLGRAPAHDRLWWEPEAGSHEVVVIDELGASARRSFEVRRRM